MASATNCIPYSSSFSSKRSPFSNNIRRNPVVAVTCKAQNGENSPGKLDRSRRDVLLGLGGVYGTSLAANPLALANPALPDFKDCVDATQPDETRINCCPPAAAGIQDYVPSATTLRTRISAQSVTVDSDYYRKYSTAIQRMRNLSPADPRNFRQQANVHCAYCDGGYTQKGNPQLLYEVHNSWLFLPWHRWYLYFFEKICQNLLDDDTFALPFWNWDASGGMQIPSIYNSAVSSPLYDCFRNQAHLPPSVVDLDYAIGDAPIDPTLQIKYNLSIMYSQMITQSKTPTDFFGDAYRAGDDISTLDGAGEIEQTPHNNVHSWTGTIDDINNPIDMGTFYSAARDPIFYAHHSNIDRMWTIWLNQLNKTNLTDPDWLNAYFIFYNEKAKPVRVRVKDCLDTTKLGYKYEDVPIPWLDAGAKPQPRAKAKTLPSAPDPSQVFPTTLDRTINVLVQRPTRSGSGSPEELLIIEGIQYDKSNYVKFNVYINEDNVNDSRPDNSEYLGSFTNVPHGVHRMSVRTNKKFRITDVLDDLGAQDYDRVLVTLVPKSSTPVTINGVRIQFDTAN